MPHRKLLLLKWLLVFTPPTAALVGHGLLGHPVTVSSLAENLFVAFLLLGIMYAFAETLFRVLRRLQAEASAREQELQTMNVVMQERERLSRELHDGVAQLVADLLLRLDTIKALVEDNRPHEAEIELERLHGVADEIYEDIGESITGLRSNVAEKGLINALQDYVDQFEERHQIATRLQILTGQAPDAADQLSPLAALQIFRFIQEALTNVRKHAGAREVTVTLLSEGARQLKVVVADDGQGFTPGSQRNGLNTKQTLRPLGLTSMRERIEALGGIFQVNSQPGSGTEVTATIPLPPTRTEHGLAAFTPPLG